MLVPLFVSPPKRFRFIFFGENMGLCVLVVLPAVHLGNAPPFLFLPPDLGACSTSLSSKRDITTIPERRQGTLALNP